MLTTCVCPVLSAFKAFNNAMIWLVRAMSGIGLEWVEGEGLQLVLLSGILFTVYEI